MTQRLIKRILAASAAALMAFSAGACARTEIVESEYWEYEDGGGGTKGTGATASADAESGDPAQSDAVTSGGKATTAPAPDTLTPSGGKNLNGAKVSIAAWGSGMGPDASKSTYKKETELVADIEKKYNCKLEWVKETDPIKYTSLFTTAAMAGSKFADIVYLPGDTGFPGPVLKGYFQPLDSLVDIKLPQWNQQITNEVLAIKGKHYLLVPMINTNTMASSGIYFNKALFKKFDVSTPYDYMKSNSWNWDNFLKTAQALTRKDGDQTYYGLGNLEPTTFIRSNGVLPTKKVNGKETFNLDNAQAIQAIQFVYDLYNTYQVIPTSGNQDKWLNGASAMYVGAWYYGKEYMEALGDSNVGFAYMPIGKAVKDYYYPGLNSSVVGIPSTVKNADVIAQILTDFTALYKWRPTTEKSMEPFFGDATGLSVAVDQVSRANRDMQWVSVYPYFTWQVLWKDYGIRDKISPQAYIDSIKQASIDDINAMWNS